MRTLTRALLVAALAVPAMASGLSVSERAGLSAAAAPALEDLRAAGVVAREFGDADRAALAAAQQRAPELGELRGGHDVHLDDHDLKVIGITMLIVLLIVIIA